MEGVRVGSGVSHRCPVNGGTDAGWGWWEVSGSPRLARQRPLLRQGELLVLGNKRLRRPPTARRRGRFTHGRPAKPRGGRDPGRGMDPPSRSPGPTAVLRAFVPAVSDEPGRRRAVAPVRRGPSGKAPPLATPLLPYHTARCGRQYRSHAPSPSSHWLRGVPA